MQQEDLHFKSPSFCTTVNRHLDAYMTPPAPSKPAWRWKSTIWCIIGTGLTFMIYQCFLGDQRQSGSYGCEMSYMWPTYHPVDWPDNPSKKYSLYLYREQGWDRDDRVSLLDLSGQRLIQ